MANGKKPDFNEIVMATLPVMGGAVLGDIALDIIEDYVMPYLNPPPATGTPPIANKMMEGVPPLILMAAGFGLQYYGWGQKDKDMYVGLGTGLVSCASIELSRKYMPDLSGTIGRNIINPLMRVDRTIPKSNKISK